MNLRFGRRNMSGALAPVLLLIACSAQQGGFQPLGFQPGRLHVPRAEAPVNDASSLYGLGKIRHVVVIFQENRTVDNLFNGLPGADTVKSGKNSKGQEVRLQPEPLTAYYDINHSHAAFLTEWNHGRINGFDRVGSHCTMAGKCPHLGVRAYGYVPRGEIRPYFDLAEQYTFGDRMFQTNQGPSFPAHQYLVSGTSTTFNDSPLRAAENAGRHRGGCDSPKGTFAVLIDEQGHEAAKEFPCYDRSSIFTLLDESRLSWKYYQHRYGAGTWNGVDALEPIWQNHAEYSKNVVAPSKQVLTDIGNRKLAQVVFVTPSADASDHAALTDGTGPDWVAAIVNAIGASPYWNSTAIFITWDDWGGWYDHVAPTIYDSYEEGFRVPLIVVSPYAKAHYVSHEPYEFGSILKFIERVFGLPSLGTTDARANELSDCFDFGRAPRRFQRIPTQRPAEYFLTQPASSKSPDDD